MSAWLVAARAMQFAAVGSLFGGLVYRSFISSRTSGDDPALSSTVAAGQWTVARWSLGLAIASGIVWLGVATTDMSGLPLRDAFVAGALPLVTFHTEQGHIWLLRLALAILLAVLLAAANRKPKSRHYAKLTLAALVVACILVASLAWSSHAAAVPGIARRFRLSVDALHLLAAGAWVGALPGLAMFLRAGPTTSTATIAIRRFSTLGITSVGLVLATGVVNTWYLVGSVHALVATPYGRLLCAKIALFSFMVVIATVNRILLTPRIAREGAAAIGKLHRNALIELGAGVLIVCIVAALGAMVPAAHTESAASAMHHH